jgi:hypothetical protein
MTQAIIIGVVILGLVLAVAIYVSKAMRKEQAKRPPPDGSGADPPVPDSSNGGHGDSDGD